MRGLSYLYLKANYLYGSSEMLSFLSPSVISLDLSKNLFGGKFPFDSLGYILNDLYLGFNYFTGTLPSDLEILRHTENLDISYNKYVGTIPSEFNAVSPC